MSEEEKRGNLSRRDFLIAAAAGAAGLAGLRHLARPEGMPKIRSFAQSTLKPGLAIVHARGQDGEEREAAAEMTRRAVEALGGMDGLVSEGDRVVIKPNMAWVRSPRFATNTNPWVVAALVELCREAGAGEVLVMDNTISKNPRRSYETSGVAAAAREAGAEVPFVNRSAAVELEVPEATVLGKWPFCREFIDADRCDVLINVPILKDHGTSRLSIGLKNAFGMVAGERGKLHPQIHRKIPDIHRLLRVDLTVMDCYRVLRRHGPTGGSLEDVDNSLEGARRVVAGIDPVAVDAYGAHMFGFEPEQIGFVRNAAEAGLGKGDWRADGVLEETI